MTRCWCHTPPPPPQPKSFSITPDFYVSHVVYAPPGNSSSIEYSASRSVGSTTSISNGIKNDTSVKAEASGSFFGSASVNVSAGLETSTTTTDDVEFNAEYTQGYTSHGQVDRIDHNYDEIWFLIHPKVDVTVYPATSTQASSLGWKFGQQDGINKGILYMVYAGWLNNAMQMPISVKQTLDAYGITPSMYPTLLSADPLFTAGSPNQLMDPGRFEFIGAYPFIPPYSATEFPSQQSYTVDESTSNTHTWESSDDISVGFGVEAGVDYGVFSAKLEIQSTWTWSHSASFADSMGTGSSDSFTVGQPEFGYTGPTLLRVYQDRIFRTYAFTLDWPQGETNLALHRAAWQSSDLPGYDAVAGRATDGNTSGNFWDGSVTHTDWGWTSWEEHWPGQYWAVDLGSEKVVTAVNIYNRTDCCSERLSNYNILAYDSAEGVWKLMDDGHATENTTNVAFFHLPVKNSMVRTQYVMVAKTDDNALQLAEVQVMGF